ncbi:uncharacterized protein LOC123534800 [Mercenaria mercenaria]|uniref:uncharacterized protein LOC123534800 n=1 Tax=Mercenaria mercenaria TaxID=6596 RepID=UPI00234E6C2D|nr:uncharacterized protein LOC123534800 [Mercenaria mercenaria]
MILLGYLLCTLYSSVKGDAAVNNSFGYPLCQGLSYHFEGYSYIHVPYTHERLWTQCSFPNPLVDHKLCGRPKINGRHFLCDPDKLIDSDNTGMFLDGQLRELQRKTSTLCVNTNGESESFIVAVAVIDKILIPDLQSPDLCSNECGRLEPYLDLELRYPSNTEQEEIMRNFADNLRLIWSLGSCYNDVIILYCREFNKVHVSAGLKASYYLTKDVVTDLQDTFIYYVNAEGFTNGLRQGLLHMIDSLRVTLRGFTPAHAIILVHVSTLLVVGTLLFLYLFVRKTDSNVWGYTYPWAISDLFLEFISGILFIRGIILAMAYISQSKGQGLLWALGAASVGVFTCFLLFLISL